ncbi:sulfite exporter TauE/SafE family protein [Ureibacillus thermophilus]|uniref:sulfite exporter TauE/SafE family protein n=1 Tax=Ureibacillus thermophilus TaxID=367743 RepID=UPI003615D373
MAFTFAVVIFCIGFVGSFVSGMVGIGGSIIKYPMLLYLPPLFGLASFTAHEVSGISAIQVFFSSLAGIWSYRKDGYLNKTLILYMGVSILAGSLLGSFGSNYFSEEAINFVYGLLAIIAALLMFIPTKEIDDISTLTFNKWLAASLAFIVGIGSGIVGAAGGFLLVPILLVILKIPTRVTIATSLAVTFISSIGGTFGKIITNQIDYWSAFIMIIASITATPLGAKVGKKMDTKVLKVILAVLITAAAIKTWIDIL